MSLPFGNGCYRGYPEKSWRRDQWGNSDRVIASAIALQAFGKHTRPSSLHNKGISMDFFDRDLLNELLNYSPNKTNKMYTPFAVTGTIINLLQFEQSLIKLGYKGPSVFEFRGHGVKTPLFSDKPMDAATYITVGGHADHKEKGTYAPAMNHGSIDETQVYNVNVPREWLLAMDIARANIDLITKVVLTTEDKVAKKTDDQVYYVNKHFEIGQWKKVKPEYMLNAHANSYKFFDKKENAVEYIRENKPFYSVKNVLDILKAHTGRTNFVLTPYYPKDFVKETL